MLPMYKITSTTDIENLLEEASQNPRLRKNLNLHHQSDPVQRFFNALIPGTYVRPHRHATPPKTETMILIKGKMVVVIFDEKGKILEKIEISKEGQRLAIDFPPHVWHSVYALEPTVFFECKMGPYIPTNDKDFATWAPEENTKEAPEYLKKLMDLSPAQWP